jgi:hypothetical protein
VELEQYLNEWLQGYVDPDPLSSNLTEQALRPLVAGSLEFMDEPAAGEPVKVRRHGTPNFLLESFCDPMHMDFCLPMIGKIASHHI